MSCCHHTATSEPAIGHAESKLDHKQVKDITFDNGSSVATAVAEEVHWNEDDSDNREGEDSLWVVGKGEVRDES